jgi:hypothetical protein
MSEQELQQGIDLIRLVQNYEIKINIKNTQNTHTKDYMVVKCGH